MSRGPSPGHNTAWANNRAQPRDVEAAKELGGEGIKEPGAEELHAVPARCDALLHAAAVLLLVGIPTSTTYVPVLAYMLDLRS